MKLVLFLVCNLVFLSSNAQNIILQGQILNAETHESLPFVNILMLGKKIGTSADENGNYKFAVPGNSDFLNEYVRITYIGFADKTLKLDKLKDARILLQPKVGALEEVFLYNIKNRHHENLNPFSGKELVGLGNFSGGAYPSSLARFYAKPADLNNAFIKSVTVYYFTTELRQSEMPAKFRLRILSVTPDGRPGEDILPRNLVVQKDRAQLKTKIDLLKDKIKIPENGFFIAVEHLFIPENKFVEIKTFKVNDSLVYKDVKLEKYAPIFKGVLEENNGGFNSYYQSISGWKKMNNLDNSSDLLDGKLPAPAFKVEITD